MISSELVVLQFGRAGAGDLVHLVDPTQVKNTVDREYSSSTPAPHGPDGDLAAAKPAAMRPLVQE